MVATVNVEVSQARVYALGNYPTVEVRVAQARVLGLAEAATTMEVSQARVFALGRGRVSDPKVRTWTFSLDGHDFYVVRLGNIETLVYDATTKEWYEWGSNDSPLWAAYTGASWYAGRRLGAPYGTNIVAGSDANGAIYFMSPLDDEDDDAVEGAAVKRPFTRCIVAQMVLTGGYDSVPCFGVQAFGSVGQSADGNVTLEVSDNRGESYEDMGTRAVAEGDRSYRLEWQSLGSMVAPGRLFRVTDTGALRRIDGLEMVTPDA